MTAPRPTAAALIVLVLGVAVVALTPASVRAQVPDANTRSMTLDRVDVNPGDPVIASMVGLRGESLTLTVCGNLAKRGSVDCANGSSVSDEIVPAGISYTQIVVQAPPAPCPCIVRAVANDTRDFMVAPITILGHPVAEVVSPTDGPLVEVGVDARRAPDGILESLRSALGGRTTYEVTVTVRNTTTEPLTRIALRGSMGHWMDDYAAELTLESPPALAPGQTWTQHVVAEAPAPSVGSHEFEVVASGAGVTVAGTAKADHHPLLLYLSALILLLDLGWMAWRWIAARMRGKNEEDDRFGAEQDDDIIDLDEVVVADIMPSSPRSDPIRV